MKKQFLILCALVLCLPVAQAEVVLSSLFQDHMVLQRDQHNYVWGWADAGEAIEVSFDGQSLSTTANAGGSWYVLLPPSDLGDAKTLTVQGTNTVTVSDILMGDVWVCSGQSNMCWPVSASKDAE